MHGKGTYKWQDGRMYHGQYSNDKKHGFGVYVWVDGRAYLGNWTQGKQDSERVYILPNGSVRKGIYEDNNRKEWINISEEEQERYKLLLEEAQRAASQVNVQVDQALKEYADIKSRETFQLEQHAKDERLVTEAVQVIEEQIKIQESEAQGSPKTYKSANTS